MANEITVRSNIQIAQGNLKYRSPVQGFQATMTGTGGPTPGQISATVAGTLVDLTQLTTPSICEFTNLDTTNYVKVGIYDTGTNRFYPLMKIEPGENYVIRLADVTDEFAGTGTALIDTDQRLMVKANSAACKVIVNAFED